VKPESRYYPLVYVPVVPQRANLYPCAVQMEHIAKRFSDVGHSALQRIHPFYPFSNGCPGFQLPSIEQTHNLGRIIPSQCRKGRLNTLSVFEPRERMTSEEGSVGPRSDAGANKICGLFLHSKGYPKKCRHNFVVAFGVRCHPNFTTLPPSARPKRKSAQSAIMRLRFSIMSPRRYAASTALLIRWARATSAMSPGY